MQEQHVMFLEEILMKVLFAFLLLELLCITTNRDLIGKLSFFIYVHPAFLTCSDCRTPTYKNIFGFKTSTSVNRQATKRAKKN